MVLLVKSPIVWHLVTLSKSPRLCWIALLLSVESIATYTRLNLASVVDAQGTPWIYQPYPFSQGRLETRLTGVYGGYDGYDIPSGQRLQTTMERSTMLWKWVNPLFRLGHGFNFANCKRLPEGSLQKFRSGRSSSQLVQSPTPWTSIAMLC